MKSRPAWADDQSAHKEQCAAFFRKEEEQKALEAERKKIEKEESKYTTEIEKVTVLRAVHKYKDAREQFEKRTHKRLIDIKDPSKETIDAFTHLDIPSGVDINIKL